MPGTYRPRNYLFINKPGPSKEGRPPHRQPDSHALDLEPRGEVGLSDRGRPPDGVVSGSEKRGEAPALSPQQVPGGNGGAWVLLMAAPEQEAAQTLIYRTDR